jgi:diaminohydroxyphosphoribosylaminopyrimidine deaminase/5-amino-6-(5-phosphoribosylamino)uracil reductase
MWRALALARRGGRVHPNPQVGCVLVKGGRIVGEGWHKGVGTPHAEQAAIEDAGPEAARGATAYVTLEPCAHTVRPDGTPRTPCAERCVAAGVAGVVCAMEDPDPRVAGRGFARLRDAGISVEVGTLGDTARALLRGYVKQRTTSLPYVLHKAAMTFDGKIAAMGGDSKWVTGEKARAYVHRHLRDRCDAVVVGVGTVLADDPSLTTRLRSGRNGHDPVRVVVDSALRTPLGAKVARPGTLVLAAEGRFSEDDRARLEDTGAEVLSLPAGPDGRVSIEAALRLLAERGLYDVLLEAGGELAAGFYAAGLVDRALFFVAPKIIGGRDAPTPVGGEGVGRAMSGALRLGRVTVRRFGDDVALEADVLQ